MLTYMFDYAMGVRASCFATSRAAIPPVRTTTQVPNKNVSISVDLPFYSSYEYLKEAHLCSRISNACLLTENILLPLYGR